MFYKETLFFIAKCLTLFWEEKNRILIQERLEAGDVDWEAVVKVSTSHYVFPALYCNLKRVDFLGYVPKDLVAYMEHITNLNRDRNLKILNQAKELNELLLDNHINPIFIKGTGNLLEDLYGDLAERMVGDIDFIVSKDDYLKTVKLLKSDNYVKISKNFSDFRHYPRLSKEKKIASVEVHKELLLKKYTKEFNFKLINKDSLTINKFSLLSFENQLLLSIISNQINNAGFYYKTISLRNAYDVYLLSMKTNAKNSLQKLNRLKKPLNSFLAICHLSFGEIESLDYHKTRQTIKYRSNFDALLSDDLKRKSKRKSLDRKAFINTRLYMLYRSIFYKEYRDWLLKRISDPSWQGQKLQQLGLKKRKQL